MNENDALVMAAYHAMAANLEVIYSNTVTQLPPEKYCQTLSWALWNNDAEMLMEVLDGQDINPWDISFVEDGLGEDSPDEQSIIEFAARKKSWACVAELVQHYLDCGQGMAVYATTGPAMVEYDAATDPARIEYLETMLRWVNIGYAKQMAARGCRAGADMVFQPAYPGAYPKSTRFILKDFAAIKFSCKGLGPIAEKRLALRQKAVAAISAGDCVKLGSALDCLNANAMAQQTAKRVHQDALTPSEIETFTAMGMVCDYPQCVNAVLSKVIEFQKAKSTAKAAGKKISVEQLKILTSADTSNLVNKILYIAKVIDYQCNGAKLAPPASVEAAIEKALFSTLSEAGDRYFIDKAKSKSDEGLTVMQACVNQACAHAESRIEKQAIAASMSENDQAVNVPRERARL